MKDDRARHYAFDDWHARTGGTLSEFNHRGRSLWHKIGTAQRRLQNDPAISERKRQLLKADIERWTAMLEQKIKP
jgi:hypothetical protein